MIEKNMAYWLSHGIARKKLRFELYSSYTGGGWSWSLKAGNTTLLFSENYITKAYARRGMNRFIAAVATAIEEDCS